MITKSFDIKHLLHIIILMFACSILMCATTYAQSNDTIKAQSPSLYELRHERYIKRWNKLIPNQATVQYAGSIGMFSAGAGWRYGRNHHWETDLLLGFLPKYHSETAHMTFTIKERYIPWHCKISSRWDIEPLTTGIFFNTISGEDFWKHLPSRYPKHYYGFSTKIRSNVFLGQR